MKQKVGIHARPGRERIASKHVAHVLNDETQRKYIQAIKRLISKCQQFFVANPSMCVELDPNMIVKEPVIIDK
jgi:pre-mRNA-splicing factor 18